jgi:hypothetical protein
MKQVSQSHVCASVQAVVYQNLQVQGLCRYDFDNNMAVLKLCDPTAIANHVASLIFVFSYSLLPSRSNVGVISQG